MGAGEQLPYTCLSWSEGLACAQDIDDANSRLDATTFLARLARPGEDPGSPLAIPDPALSAGHQGSPTHAHRRDSRCALNRRNARRREKWDYRLDPRLHVRAAGAALAQPRLEADEFMQFIAELEPNNDGSLQIMYGIDGRRDLTESTRDDLTGYAGARPVHWQWGIRPASKRRLWRRTRLSPAAHTSEQSPARSLWPIVQAQADVPFKFGGNLTRASWEARGAPQHCVSSKLMCWVALDRAAKLAEIRGDPRSLSKWRETAVEFGKIS